MTFKSRWGEIAMAVALASVVIMGYPFLEREFNRDSSIDEFFVVRQLEVAPITPLGQVPAIVFDRIVVKDFKASWLMEVQTVEGDQFNKFCTGEGQKDYVKDETLENQGESLIWFTERFPDCFKIKDTLGRYRIVVSWGIDRGSSYYDYKLEKISNVFEIVDPATFVPTKEQEALNKVDRIIEEAAGTEINRNANGQ